LHGDASGGFTDGEGGTEGSAISSK
jgi:hypothetical protein